MEFLRFFEEATNAVDVNTGRPALEVDDIIVVDNLPAHHGEGERALREVLEEMSIELMFLPIYSSELNQSSGRSIFQTKKSSQVQIQNFGSPKS